MPQRILIADDEPAIATSLQFLFGNAGFDTQTARDGEEALRLACLLYTSDAADE